MKGKKGSCPVIIDTNALIMQVEYRINFERELAGILGSYEILIPTMVLKELHGIGDKHSKAALKLAKRYRLIESTKSGDEAIISLAGKFDAIVITNDRALRRRLREKGHRVIYIRQRSYLVMDES
jgi:rRNA-processing protein FCF1